MCSGEHAQRLGASGKYSTDLDPPEHKENLCPPGQPDWGTHP